MSEPTTIGPYRIIRELGRGGMGVVYLVERDGDDTPLALKVLTESQDEKLLARFFREASVGEGLHHPDIVRVLDHGKAEDRAYIAMEFLEGFELEKAMYDPTFDLVARLSVLVRVADALHYVHERGLVHRDVKPSNIFLTHDGGVRLLDFGIAFLRDHRLTRTGMLMGTPHYMSPEQLSSGTVSKQSDVFALGVVAFRLLTNKFPWDGESIAQVMFSIATAPPARFVDAIGYWDFDLPQARLEQLAGIVHKALASEPTHRHETALELGSDFEAFLQGAEQILAGPTPTVDSAQVAARRIEWAQKRAARLHIESTDVRPISGHTPVVEDDDSDRDFGPVVWFALVIAFAAGLIAAVVFALFGAR